VCCRPSLTPSLDPLSPAAAQTLTPRVAASSSSVLYSVSAWSSLLLCLGLLSSFSFPAFAQTAPSQNPSRGFGPGACGPADPAYIRTATETGGIPLFLQRSEATKSFHLVRESTRNNVATVFWASGTLDGTQTFHVPIDSATQRITFALSVDTKEPNPRKARGLSEPDTVHTTCGRFTRRHHREQRCLRGGIRVGRVHWTGQPGWSCDRECVGREGSGEVSSG
jgi:hypothetical protein